MERERNWKNLIIGALLVTVVCLSVAFSAMARTLEINGTVNLPEAKWDVKFTDVSLSAGSIDTLPTMTNTTVTYTVDLVENSTYEFDAVITNAGTYDAKLSTLEVNDVPAALTGLVTYTVTGVTEGTTTLSANGGTATVHVKITMGAIDTEAKLNAVQANQTLSLTVVAEFVQV